MADKKIKINEFANIALIDPNWLQNDDGGTEERFVNHDELVMYANLECDLQERSRLLVGKDKQTLETIPIASVNFLKPGNKDYLSTDWTLLSSQTNNDSIINNELLGITNITYKCGASFIPTISVTLEDVRGRALFEKGNNSVYSVFFNLPYPTFYLTLKGYYGKAVRYPIILQKFQASFQQSSGNFQVTLDFLGYKYNVLTDVQQAYLLALPTMYTQQINENVQTEPTSTTQNTADQINGSETRINSTIIHKGYEEIKKVYEIYKKKKLIDEKFPELTVQQLIVKLENFEKNVLSNFGSVSLSSLSDAKQFQELLNEYRKKIITETKNSWKNKYLNNLNYYVVKENGKTYNVYTYSQQIIKDSQYDNAITELQTIINTFNDELAKVPTFGKNAGEGENRISVNIDSENVKIYPDNISYQIDIGESAKQRNTSESTITGELNELRTAIANDLQRRSLNNVIPISVPFFFRFDGDGYFDTEISDIEKILNDKKTKLEKKLTSEINLLLSSKKGIGFEPTIRNIIGVIMASTDAFLRLMEKTHTDAFKNGKNPSKIAAVNQSDYSEGFVFPWPQYAEEITTEDGEIKYELKYPGDPESVDRTKGDDYIAWPEVEFVEEFVKGYNQRTQTPIQTFDSNNDETSINRLLISGFDILSNQSYSVLQDIKFIYEVWERIQAIAQYQGFVRNNRYSTILNLLQAYEATNIINGIGFDDPELINQFKSNFGLPEGETLTPENYLNQVLKNASIGGQGTFWQNLIRANYNTDYLSSELLNPSRLKDVELPIAEAQIVTDPNGSDIEESMEKYLNKPDKNEIEFTDCFPFIDKNYNLQYLFEGNQNNLPSVVLGTDKSLIFDPSTKKIINYRGLYALENKGDITQNRPFQFFVNTNNPINYESVKTNMADFYSQRIYNYDKEFSYTEGIITSQDRLKDLNYTSSMLNTPMFVKAIQNGVINYKSGSEYPYTQAAFLFLNSLPLSTLSEPYRNSDGSKNDYIGPTLSKYGGIHALPKLWIAKIGSLWNRYKSVRIDGSDMLASCLTPFSLNRNAEYDPLTFNPNKLYTFSGSTDPSSTASTISIKLTDSFTNTQGETLESMMVGFYPRILNDFFYFYNDFELYTSVSTIQEEIQQKIDDGSVILLSNSDSKINKPLGYDPGNPNTSLNYGTVSLLFKSFVPNSGNQSGNFYFSAPSFGSRYTQVTNECFENGNLVTPIYGNDEVFNGSTRVFWGGTHFGYYPNQDSVNSILEYFTDVNYSAPFKFNFNDVGQYVNNFGVPFTEECMFTFSKDELDLFEQVFLDFSKSQAQTTEGFNIQTILREGLQIKESDFTESGPNLIIEKYSIKQQLNFNNIVNNYINLNTIFERGNPTKFNFKTFAALTNESERFVLDSGNLIFDNYDGDTPNALPQISNSTTFNELLINYPNEMVALYLNVGDFQYTNLDYNLDTEPNFIFEFFTELNIGFTVDNIIVFADLIKIYASKRIQNIGNPSYNFRQDIEDYLNRTLVFRDEIFTGVISKVQKSLPDAQQNANSTNQSLTTGVQSKLEYYQMFKAVNDKWVAANNYESETLFEDILFLDRANRDIGSKVIVDVFKVTSLLKSNPKASVYNIVSSIIQTNNFIMFSMPAYINFYNVQTVGEARIKQDTPSSFADKMFGTFSEVDYQDSKSKLVCQYVETPSEQLNNPNQFNGFKDDSWNFGEPNPNPLIEDTKLKEIKDDWALSNKVVGFQVDFGLQNQNIFKDIQVSQDIGKPTAESLQMEFDIANLNSGTKGYTQSVSLYNIYKTRSYSSTITSLGNAMIQPTMYFVLRNVPLFAGPYLITEVEHIITVGSFTTKMVGTRQKLYTPPLRNALLSVIKENFVTSLVSDLYGKRQSEKQKDENNVTKKNTIINSLNSSPEPSSNRTCTPIPYYRSYSAVTTTQAAVSVDQMRRQIRTIAEQKNSVFATYWIYSMYYLKSYDGKSFKVFNNNPQLISIGNNSSTWGGNLNNYFDKTYICMDITPGTSESIASFPNLENAINFSFDKYSPSFKKITDKLSTGMTESDYVTEFTRTWIEKVPLDITQNTDNFYDNFVNSNPTELQKIQTKVAESYKTITAFLST
jgi:hypothetical protein